jgi:AcrR family transcriptional regulator
LRDEQRDLTRSRIVRAVLDLLETDSPATISVPAVAGRAGVSLRTVYRYFPTKADLIHSAAHVFDDPITQRLGQRPDDRGADLGEYLRRLWAEFGQNVPAVRAQHQSAAGREIRAARLDEFRARIGLTVAKSAPDLSDEERADFVDLLIALSSSSMFLELVDRMGHRPEHAADMALRAIGALQNEIRASREKSS